MLKFDWCLALHEICMKKLKSHLERKGLTVSVGKAERSRYGLEHRSVIEISGPKGKAAFFACSLYDDGPGGGFCPREEMKLRLSDHSPIERKIIGGYIKGVDRWQEPAHLLYIDEIGSNGLRELSQRELDIAGERGMVGSAIAAAAAFVTARMNYTREVEQTARAASVGQMKLNIA